MFALPVVYGLFLVYVVLRLFRTPSRNASDYIVAGRRLTLPGFVATLVASWYGGILGVGEYTWEIGVSNWLVFGVPYYLYAGIFAFFLAGRARRSRMLTLPDQLAAHYGTAPALIGAVVLFVMTVPAAYVLMLGVLVEWVTGWPLWLGVVVGTALSVGYVFRGGLRAIVGTDMVQFVLMFLGFAVLVPVCVVKLGGWSTLSEALARIDAGLLAQGAAQAGHLSWDGGLGLQAVAVWYFIAMTTLVEPTFFQRCYAARTERTAKVGIGLAIGLWIVFDFLTTTAGLYARVALDGKLERPMLAFPALAVEVLPEFWAGVFMAGLLATIMSTVDSYAFISAVTGGRDIVLRFIRRDAGGPLDDDRDGSLTYMRWGLLAAAVLSVVLALWAQSVITLWKLLGSLATPVLLLPVALSHTRWRVSGRVVSASMLLSGLTVLVWLALGGGEKYLGVESIFPGLAVSVVVVGIGVVRGLPLPPRNDDSL